MAFPGVFRSFSVCLVLMLSIKSSVALPETGKWDFDMSPEMTHITVIKSIFADSKIYVQILCVDASKVLNFQYTLEQLICPEPENIIAMNQNKSLAITSNPQTNICVAGGHVELVGVNVIEVNKILNRDRKDIKLNAPKAESIKSLNSKTIEPIITVPKDGIFKFVLEVNPEPQSKFNISVHIEILSSYGYLSAADWPLLLFYGAMCLVYVVLGIIWLAVSFSQWRDLLRIQFWIGGVILLGMLEKAMFYAEYHSINVNGYSIRGVVLTAEWVSCCKRTLARMLVIIVSLGFGIVKPRLGPMLHRVVGTGGLYLILACVEGYLRVMHTKNDPSNQLMVASVPLAVLDSAICWWIFTSLVQTTRTLRLRRNLIKLTLYGHFTNTLIFAVIASVIFMLYSIKAHRMSDCYNDWKELWVDEAFWHVLFSVLLLVIMILWRPTNNNQRYAFTPLLDHEEDEEDEEEQFVSDAYGVKMRGPRSTSPKLTKSPNTEEDDLRWVEDNIPSSLLSDSALPILDSDEEILNTKFEVSKMQ